MFGLNVEDIFYILGFIVGLPIVYIAIYTYFKQKPFFQFRGTKFQENQTILYWRFKISNTTSTSFVLNKVFIKRHFFMFLYKNKSELKWHANYEFHKNTNPFENSDSIKPNEDVNIIVKPSNETEMDAKYYSFNNMTKKYKFIFETSLKTYKKIIKEDAFIDSSTGEKIRSRLKKRKNSNFRNPITDY